MNLTDTIAGAEVIVCCGPGGVGKTTTAAAIGLEAARGGRRVVVVTIDPAKRLADALGLDGGLDGEPRRVATGRTAPGELWAMMLDTPAMFERVVRANAADPVQVDRIMQNRFYRNIAGALSGTQEYMASEALYELHGDPRFDLVVVDTPPSRNALDFLDAPGVLARFLDHPVFRLMMLPTRTGLRVFSVATQPLLKAIGRVVGSDVLGDAVAFFQAFTGMESGFRARADAVTRLLRNQTTEFVVVAAPRHDVVEECTWFTDQLSERGFGTATVVVNRLHPRFGIGTAADADERARAATDPERASLWSNLAELRRTADAEREALSPLLARVGEAIIEVPLLPGDVHDVETLDLLADHLFGRSVTGG